MLRTVKDFEHERFGAHHVDAVALRSLQVKKNDTQQYVHENIAKKNGFHAILKERSNK